MTNKNVINMPAHVAIIMDGNGRWATKRGLPRNQGHKAGAKRLLDIAQYANMLQIKYLTVYAFSTENWSRPVEEVEYLMNSCVDFFNQNIDKFHNQKIKVSFIGTTKKVPDNVLEVMNKVSKLTKDNKGTNLIIAFNYGFKEEMTQAIINIIDDNIPSSQVNPELINNYLYTKDIPDVDLMIRTSGEMRLSNFLLWQNAYSEFYFTKTLWPDLRKKEFLKIIENYQNRERRFGGIRK